MNIVYCQWVYSIWKTIPKRAFTVETSMLSAFFSSPHCTVYNNLQHDLNMNVQSLSLSSFSLYLPAFRISSVSFSLHPHMYCLNCVSFTSQLFIPPSHFRFLFRSHWHITVNNKKSRNSIHISFNILFIILDSLLKLLMLSALFYLECCFLSLFFCEIFKRLHHHVVTVWK